MLCKSTVHVLNKPELFFVFNGNELMHCWKNGRRFRVIRQNINTVHNNTRNFEVKSMKFRD